MLSKASKYPKRLQIHSLRKLKRNETLYYQQNKKLKLD